MTDGHIDTVRVPDPVILPAVGTTVPEARYYLNMRTCTAHVRTHRHIAARTGPAQRSSLSRYPFAKIPPPRSSKICPGPSIPLAPYRLARRPAGRWGGRGRGRGPSSVGWNRRETGS
jgi:hypothetical protein